MDNLTGRIMVRVDDALMKKIEAEAGEKGLKPSTLVRMALVERYAKKEVTGHE